MRGLSQSGMVLFACLAMLSGCAGGPPRVLQQVAGNSESLRSVWSGYDASKRAFGVFDRHGRSSWVYYPLAQPDDFSAYEVEFFWHLDRWPDDLVPASFDTGVDLGVVSATFIQERVSREELAFLLHEDFHAFQRETFAPSETGGTLAYLDLNGTDARLMIATMAAEHALLKRALRSVPVSEASDALVSYLALRHWRTNQMPAVSLAREHRNERIEGSATWFEAQALSVMQGGADATQRIEREMQAWQDESAMSVSQHWLTSRCYGTGAALLEIAQRLGIDNWQQRIRDGEAPLDLLREALPYPDAELTLLARKAREMPSFTAYYDAAGGVEDELAVNGKRVVEVLKRHPYRLIIQRDGPRQTVAGLLGGFSVGEVLYLPDGRTLLADVSNYRGRAEGLMLDIDGRPTVIPQDDAEPQIVVYLRRPPLDESKKPLAEGSYRVGQGEFTSSGFRLRHTVPLRLRLDRIGEH